MQKPPDESTAQQRKLFEEACKWFKKAWRACQRGDKAAHQVAMLAHSMTRAAYNNTLRPETADED